MNNNMTNEQAQAVVSNMMQNFDAALKISSENAPFETYKLVVDLTTAKTRSQGLALNFPFRSVVVKTASDTATQINLVVDTDGLQQGEIPLNKNDSLTWGTPRTKAILYWDAQAGKTITLIFLVTGELRTGSMNSEVSSSVESNSLTTVAPVTLTNVIRAIVATDANAKVVNLYNDGPDVAYIGGLGTTTANGIPLQVNSFVPIKTTAAIYGITATSAIIRILKES